jgi:hypothetical protein
MCEAGLDHQPKTTTEEITMTSLEKQGVRQSRRCQEPLTPAQAHSLQKEKESLSGERK